MRWKFSKKSYRLCITFAFLNFDFEPSAFIRLCPGWDSATSRSSFRSRARSPPLAGLLANSLVAHGCALLVPTQAKQLACSRSQTHFIRLCPGWDSATSRSSFRSRARSPPLAGLLANSLVAHGCALLVPTQAKQLACSRSQTHFIRLCPGWDSNPQVRKGQRILSPSRMPVPPPGLNFLSARNFLSFRTNY